MQRPSHASLWWFAAPQCREPRLSFSIELAVPVLPSWSIMERRFDASQDGSLP
jgi:hypothetical protein